MNLDTNWTPEKKAKFLEVLADTCNVRKACETADLPRSTVYLKRSEDFEFAEQWDRARSIGADALEEEAIRRAREGWDEPVFYKGDHVASVRKFSDTLLIFLLKGAKPEKYRENIDINAKVQTSDMSSEELDARIQALLPEILPDSKQS